MNSDHFGGVAHDKTVAEAGRVPHETHGTDARLENPIGHSVSDDHSNCADGDDHGNPATLTNPVIAESSSVGHLRYEPQWQIADARDDQHESETRWNDVIAEIREQHRQRADLHRAEKSLTLQIKAKCRRLCDGDKTDAERLYRAMMGKGEHALSHIALAVNIPFLEARSVIEASRKTTEKRLEKLAKELPISGWIGGVRGVAVGSLAAVIGETGDLSGYATVAKLWKRMGLAVIDGGRQRKVAGDAALEHGYAPYRRSIVWNIGDCLIKAQSEKVDPETGEVLRPVGEYRLLYDARKAYEIERAPDMTKGHAHNRAKRYIEKRFLRELWKAWRAKHALIPNVDTPAELMEAAD